MSGIRINPILETTVMRPLRWVSERKVIKNAGNKVYDNNRKYIDFLGVMSIILKDGLGCYLYVTQSLHNKDIPDDKRKFVASLDLTNGLLMILMQLAMFFTVSHKVCQSKMFDKFFGKMFDRPIKKTYQQLIKNKPGYEDMNGIKFTQEFEKIRENVKDAFGGITSLAAATIVGKRMIVPFIATPLAGKVEKKMDKKNSKNTESTPDNKPTGTQQPAMKGSESQTNNNTTGTNLLEKYKK